jgi:hypothetical protein
MAPFAGSVIRSCARGPSASPGELPAEVACTAAGPTYASPVSVRKLPRFRAESWTSAAPARAPETGLFAGTFSACTESDELLAMQKVEGSNPFSRFEKDLYLQAFFVCAVGLSVCVGSD